VYLIIISNYSLSTLPAIKLILSKQNTIVSMLNIVINKSKTRTLILKNYINYFYITEHYT